uniref:SSD domain-containing protein n=1 Tax=Mesocestoides corti TaxID=53468 RepID=A0A5K3FHB9_MESCO
MEEMDTEDQEPLHQVNATSCCAKSFTLMYSSWLSSHLRICAFVAGAFLLSSLTVSLCFSELPEFDDPAKEFITIGTPMAARLYQLKALQYNTISVPSMHQNIARTPRSIPAVEEIRFCFELPDQQSDQLWTRFASMGKMVITLHDIDTNQTFPTVPGAVQSLCHLQRRIEQLPGYARLCSKASLFDPHSHCCPVWSLPNFVASIVRKTSCETVTSADVARVHSLVQVCRAFFLSGELKRSCWDAASPSHWLCPGVPRECFAHPHLLLLLAIAGPLDTGTSAWNSTLFVLPVWPQVGLALWRDASLDNPQTLSKLTENLTVPLTIEAIDLGVYNDLSRYYLLSDSVWLALGAGCLAVLLLIMTDGCVSIVAVTFLAIAWSLVVAYALYTRVFKIPSFPLINMMSIVLLLGLGADDILVFFKVWKSVQPVPDDVKSLTDKSVRLATTLNHAVPSVCLTSLSTLGGLLISLNSDIVAVKRFSAFASLTVTCHMLYVFVTVPVALLLFIPPTRRTCLRAPQKRVSLAALIVRVRFIFPFLTLAVIGVSIYFLFFAGRLTFPAGSLQPAFYKETHPTEVYKRRGNEFSWAENTLRRYQGLVTVHMVWGVTERDPRSHWTWVPQEDTLQHIAWDSDFDILSPEAQSWLRTFCTELTKMPRSFVAPQIPVRRSYLEASSLLPVSSSSRCPFGRDVFSIGDYMASIDCSSVHTSPCCSNDTAACLAAYALKSRFPTGLRFSPHSSKVVGLLISAVANVSLSNATYSEMLTYTQELQSWFSSILSTAPRGLSRGFVVSQELAAFDTYQDLLKFLPLSIALSVTLAASLVYLSTLNLPLAFTSLVSVMASLLLCCLFLVAFDEWTLGIVEVLILSLSAGLAVDPCIHLAFAIVRSTQATLEWSQRCRTALETVGCAVTGAALSTAIAGSAVIPSSLKCYHQMGVFLLILMTSSLAFCGAAFVGCVACFPNKCASPCRSSRRENFS